MKKIVMIFAAMAAVLSSCQKSELESVSANDGKDIVLNISVSNPGADTKALIKSAWVEGDEISIWYDTNTGENPDLVIKYDASNAKWVQKEGATVSGKNPSEGESKYAKALYNGTVKVASKDDYTYENNTLTFSIANWVFLTEIQVVVYGDDVDVSNPSKYTLACDKFTPCTGYSIGADGITATTGTEGAAVTGIINDGVNSKSGVVFVFATAEYSSSSAAFKFSLTDGTSTTAVTKFYTATTDKISGTSGAMTAIKALTIANDKFKKEAPEGFVDLGVVVNGNPVYWAKCNLGASYPQDCGTYFSWGDVNGQTPSNGAFDAYFSWTRDVFGKDFGNVKQKDACPGGVLASEYDAAYEIGSSRRMPTKEDFAGLFSQCYAEWGTYNGVNGLFVYKTKDSEDAGFAYIDSTIKKYPGSGTTWKASDKTRPTYNTTSDTFVFFPAAGYGGSGSKKTSSPESEGRYWSSSLCITEKAYCLNFLSNAVAPQKDFFRYLGFSVRAVSD